jgi:virginiamycin B lyase
MITSAFVVGWALLLGGPPAAPAEAALDTVRIREWQVPWEVTRPRDPYVDREGRVWFVGQRGNYVASLDPSSGQFRRIDLPEKALPHNIVVGPDGYLWYAGNGDSHIGRMDPRTGKIRRFDMPDPAARDPHTLMFAPSGDLWFTVQGGNFIGRLDPKSGEVRLLKPSVQRARPYGIVVDETGRPWVVLFGTNRVATVDPATMQMREYTLPAADARPRRLARTSDGMIWYVDYARGSLGRLDPKSGAVKEWTTPGGSGSRPYAMTVDDHDRLWFVETSGEPNRMIGFDPKSQEFFSSSAIPSGGGTVRHMVFHAPTRSIWFGTDANTVGRAEVP